MTRTQHDTHGTHDTRSYVVVQLDVAGLEGLLAFGVVFEVLGGVELLLGHVVDDERGADGRGGAVGALLEQLRVCRGRRRLVTGGGSSRLLLAIEQVREQVLRLLLRDQRLYRVSCVVCCVACRAVVHCL
jgi:hypothetical protein